jgi:Tfp pilus assembly protein PilN
MIQVNLHPEGSKRRRKSAALPSLGGLFKGRGGDGPDRDPWLIGAIAVPALALLFVGWLFLSQRGERVDLESQLAEAVEDSARLSDLRALSDSLIARESAIRQRLDLVQGLDDGRFVWPHLLDEVSRALPDFAWLTGLSESSPLPALQVQVDGLAANPLAITAFVRRLQESPYVGEVRILGSQEQALQGFSAHSFSLNVGYVAPPDSLVRLAPVAGGEI